MESFEQAASSVRSFEERIRKTEVRIQKEEVGSSDVGGVVNFAKTANNRCCRNWWSAV